MADARETAVRALTAFDRGEWSDLYLSRAIKKAGLDRRDAAFATALCAGVLQNRILLDYVISVYSSVKLRKIAQNTLNILRAGAYQLLFMDRVPHSAAVNTAVALTGKIADRRTVGFVNAVLRRVAENSASPPLPDAGDRVEFFSVKYSHPKWLAEYFINRFGEDAECLMAANNAALPATVRVNTLKITPDEAVEELRGAGVTVRRHEFIKTALYIEGGGDIASLESFQNGHITVQDTASQLALAALAPEAGENVLDLCGAPGGKSFAAAALMHDRGSITVCDINPNRLRLVTEGAERLGVRSVKTMELDASQPVAEFFGCFDRVIADVPCSGLGVIRRKPEIRYKDRKSVVKFPPLQLDILKNAAKYLKTGGIMLYSTCSVAKEENEEVAGKFLDMTEGFDPVPVTLPGNIGAKDGMLTLLPHIHGTDGFFMAKFIKRK